MVAVEANRSTMSRQAIYQAALTAHRVGISVVPIPLNGSKHPVFKWEVYQHQLPSLEDLQRWFLDSRAGIALVSGQVSGNLELLDFDSHDVYEAWRERMEDQGVGPLAERLARGYLERTPNGMHQWYRCRVIESNQPLARILLGGKRKAVIETRGEGGLGVAAPSGDGVHPSGKPYVALRGSIATIQNITVPERLRLFSVARMFDESPPLPPRTYLPPRERVVASNEEGELPGRIFNRRARWDEVLTPHGWGYLYSIGEEGYWTKNNRDVHATTNYMGSDLFYVFSTSTVFEPECGYSKFAAYTLLKYGSTTREAFREAARDLAAQGYTDK